MKTKIFVHSLLSLVIGLVLVVPGTLAAAFGIAPPWIINENLKPGSSFVYEIDLNTNDPAQDMDVQTRITGDDEVLKWVTIRNASNLVMPAGQQHVPMYVEVKVPEDARPGKYKGDIGVTVIPRGIEREDVSIFLGGHISVDLQVVNYDVTDYWVKSVAVDPIVEGQPATLNLTVKNLGNTALSSLKTTVEVFNKKGDVVANGTGEQLTKLIQPHTVETAKVSVPLPDLKEGSYWLNVSAFKKGRVVYQNRLYLGVNSADINNVVQTSVLVGDESMKAAAEPAMMKASDDSMMKKENPLLAANKSSNVKVKTTVTVRAPLTNQLIGVVIILLGILILITARIQNGLFGRLGRKKKR